MASSIDLPPYNRSYPAQFLRSLFVTAVPPPKGPRLDGIITGGDSGIGLECAPVLLSLQLSTLIITSQDVDKSGDVAVSLGKTYPAAHIEVWSLEMSSYDSIQALVERCRSLLKTAQGGTSR